MQPTRTFPSLILRLKILGLEVFSAPTACRLTSNPRILTCRVKYGGTYPRFVECVCLGIDSSLRCESFVLVGRASEGAGSWELLATRLEVVIISGDSHPRSDDRGRLPTIAAPIADRRREEQVDGGLGQGVAINSS